MTEPTAVEGGLRPLPLNCTVKLKRHPVYKSQAARLRHALNDAEAWNVTHPAGSPVCVHRDNGEVLATVTRSGASIVGDTACVWVEGIAGAYALFRVHALASGASAPQAPSEAP